MQDVIFTADTGMQTTTLAGDGETAQPAAYSLPPLFPAGSPSGSVDNPVGSAGNGGSQHPNLHHPPLDGDSPQHHGRKLQLRRASASAPAQLWEGAEGGEDDSLDLYNLGPSAVLSGRLPSELRAALPAGLIASASTAYGELGHHLPGSLNSAGGGSGT